MPSAGSTGRSGATAPGPWRPGRPSNRRLAPAVRDQALALVRERHGDFGPTLAHQKLTDERELAVSVETLRGWMTAADL